MEKSWRGMQWNEGKHLETCPHYGIKGQRKQYFGLRLEFYPRDHKGNVVYVCGTCYLPFGTQIALSTYHCDCGGFYTSPWELRCRKCHDILYSDIRMENGRVLSTPQPDAPPYMDWWWLRDRLAQHLLTFDGGRSEGTPPKPETSEKKFDAVPMFRYRRQQPSGGCAPTDGAAPSKTLNKKEK